MSKARSLDVHIHNFMLCNLSLWHSHTQDSVVHLSPDLARVDIFRKLEAALEAAPAPLNAVHLQEIEKNS